MKKTINDLTKYIKKKLSYGRVSHIMGTAETAGEIADFFHLDREKALVAALAHDLAREKKKGKIKKILGERYDDSLPESLQHGAAAAVILEEKFDIHDKDILNAVASHTLGNPDPSPYDAIIYIADFLEPGRNISKKMIRRILEKNLYYLLFQVNREIINYQESKNRKLYDQTKRMQEKLYDMIQEDINS